MVDSFAKSCDDYRNQTKTMPQRAQTLPVFFTRAALFLLILSSVAPAFSLRFGPSGEYDHVSLTSPSNSGDTNKSGSGMGVAGKLFIGTQYGEIDTGIGLGYSAIDGAGNHAQIANPFVEAGYHYPAPYHFYPGFITRVHYGPAANYVPTDQSANIAILKAGPELAYAIPMKGENMRVAMAYVFDVNNSSRGVQAVVASFQYLFDFVSRPVMAAYGPPAPPAPQKQPTRIVLDERIVRFEKNSSTYMPGTESIIVNIGKILKDKQDQWVNMEVSGHADRSGRESYNVKLSLRRAEAVRRSLIKSGIAADRITAVSFGSSRPIDEMSPFNPEQRRVELKIHDAIEEANLKQAIEREVASGKK